MENIQKARMIEMVEQQGGKTRNRTGRGGYQLAKTKLSCQMIIAQRCPGIVYKIIFNRQSRLHDERERKRDWERMRKRERDRERDWERMRERERASK